MSVTVTKDWIRENTTEERILGGINSSQCKILGFEWKDLAKGWADRVEGKIISDEDAELFILLKGARGKEVQRRIIDEYKHKDEYWYKLERVIRDQIADILDEEVRKLAIKFTDDFKKKSETMEDSGWFTMSKPIELSVKIKGNKTRGIEVSIKHWC